MEHGDGWHARTMQRDEAFLSKRPGGAVDRHVRSPLLELPVDQCGDLTFMRAPSPQSQLPAIWVDRTEVREVHSMDLDGSRTVRPNREWISVARFRAEHANLVPAIGERVTGVADCDSGTAAVVRRVGLGDLPDAQPCFV